MNLIALEAHEPDANGLVVLRGRRAAHLTGVLRVAPGQTVRVGVLDGARGVGVVESVADDAVSIRCRFDEQVPARPAVDVLLAVPRPKVLRRLWAPLAALGVGRIILTNAARVERPYFDTHWLAPDTYRPLLVEGLEQARDTHVPLVSIHRQFRRLVEDDLDDLVGDAGRLVADPTACSSVTETLRRVAPRRVVVAVGPEGGWNALELGLLEAHRFVAVSLGPRTLRTDTACAAMLAVVHEALGQATGAFGRTTGGEP